MGSCEESARVLQTEEAAKNAKHRMLAIQAIALSTRAEEQILADMGDLFWAFALAIFATKTTPFPQLKRPHTRWLERA